MLPLSERPERGEPFLREGGRDEVPASPFTCSNGSGGSCLAVCHRRLPLEKCLFSGPGLGHATPLPAFSSPFT